MQSEHYYTKKPASKLKIKEIEAVIKNNKFIFHTGSSIFSKTKADKGTILLIENSIIENKKEFTVLDMGCGYGIVGICLKKLNPEISVTCSDINQRAVMLAKKNAELNNVKINTIQSNLFENIDKKFNAILINLPQNAGKKVCHDMIEQSFTHLSDNGTLQVVSRHQKGGKEYEKKMKEIFNNSEHIAKGSGYRVYLSKKNQK
ncbi:MAG: class I SAM-dependent methyltransferase [Candidatus Woesearchaeota archaeon]